MVRAVVLAYGKVEALVVLVAVIYAIVGLVLEVIVVPSELSQP